ncbi:MAG TPA: hypothetical protein VMT17_03910 [Anaeromyxobacteraceae bacterium]|nr:hypothetical protein [Anaeromyxobacteraceae bacterium]
MDAERTAASGGSPGGDEGAPPLLRAIGRAPERRALAFALSASLLLTLAAACSSDSVFQVDEYFQTVEFASYKLGTTPAAELPWEFRARIRPFLQPAFYWALARAASVAGVQDPFALLRIFRAASGVLAWLALVALLRAAARWFPRPPWRSALSISLALPYFVPYLAARTSSENLSTTFLLFGLALLAGTEEGGLPAAASGARALLAGLALGVSFECRYQVGMSVAGVVLWMLFRRRARHAALLAAGLAAAVAAGVAVDAWGYGALEFVPWNYLRVNVFEGKAATFGVLPFFAYPFVFLLLFPPFGALLFVALALFWWRSPRHLLTWVTVPFVVGHSLVGHKEFRFMFPLLAPATLCLLLLWAEPGSAAGRLARLLRLLRAVWFGRGTWAASAAAALVLCLLPSSDNFGLQRYFHDHARDDVRWVGFVDPRRPHGIPAPFLSPRPGPPVRLVRTAQDLASAIAESDRPVLVTAKFPLPAGAEELLAGTRVFASLPPGLARLNLFRWVERADLTYVYRVGRPTAPRAAP